MLQKKDGGCDLGDLLKKAYNVTTIMNLFVTLEQG